METLVETKVVKLHKAIRNSVMTSVGAAAGLLVTWILTKTGIDFGPVINPYILPTVTLTVMVLTNFCNYMLGLWRVK